MPSSRPPIRFAAALFSLAIIASCSDDSNQSDPARGGPFSSIGSVNTTDAAVLDGGGKGGAAGAAKTDGGTGGTSGHGGAAGAAKTDGGTGGGAAGASSAGGAGGSANGGAAGQDAGASRAVACKACELAKCANNDDPLVKDSYATCFTSTDTASAGRAMGVLKTQLCQAILECVRTSDCDKNAPEDCYCGIGVDATTCLVSNNPLGPCKTAIENGAESIDIGRITAEYYQADTFASGAALSLLTNCDEDVCAGPCTGSGDTSATAGTNGGTAGSSGAAGTSWRRRNLRRRGTPRAPREPRALRVPRAQRRYLGCRAGTGAAGISGSSGGAGSRAGRGWRRRDGR